MGTLFKDMFLDVKVVSENFQCQTNNLDSKSTRNRQRKAGFVQRAGPNKQCRAKTFFRDTCCVILWVTTSNVQTEEVSNVLHMWLHYRLSEA